MATTNEITWKEKSENRVDLNLLNVLGNFIQSNLVLLVTLFFLAISTYLLSYFPKGELLLRLNNINNSFFDFFFKYVTYFGDAILYLPIAIYFWFKNKKVIIPLIFLLIFQSIIVWYLKKLVFFNSLRPRAYLEEIGLFNSINKVDGVAIYCYSSFPSGHTLTAFALAFFFIFIYKVNRQLQFLFVLIAILAGISRVYLIQHYFWDVIVGAYLGIIIAFLISLKYKFKP